MKIHTAICTILALGLATAAKAAATPTFPAPYQGVWVISPDQCKSAKEGEGDGEWMNIDKTGIQGYEWGCKIQSLKAQAKTLHVKLDCSSSEGDSYTRRGQYTLTAKTLTVRMAEDDNQTSTSRYMRCR